jgi:hypothetical protein
MLETKKKEDGPSNACALANISLADTFPYCC